MKFYRLVQVARGPATADAVQQLSERKDSVTAPSHRQIVGTQAGGGGVVKSLAGNINYRE